MLQVVDVAVVIMLEKRSRMVRVRVGLCGCMMVWLVLD